MTAIARPGLRGNTGTPGTPGTTWRSGNGAPSNGTGIDGDYYMDRIAGDVYKRTAGTYAIIGNLKGIA